MRTRLLPLLIFLLALVLMALGFPLAISVASAQQQKVVVDRIDDTARFAALAQFVSAADDKDTSSKERLATLEEELARYHELYGIRAGVFFRNGVAMASAPEAGACPTTARAETPSRRPWRAAGATIRPRCGRGSADGSWWPPRWCARAM